MSLNKNSPLQNWRFVTETKVWTHHFITLTVDGENVFGLSFCLFVKSTNCTTPYRLTKYFFNKLTRDCGYQKPVVGSEGYRENQIVKSYKKLNFHLINWKSNERTNERKLVQYIKADM